MICVLLERKICELAQGARRLRVILEVILAKPVL
jgi:hypothetical protein